LSILKFFAAKMGDSGYLSHFTFRHIRSLALRVRESKNRNLKCDDYTSSRKPDMQIILLRHGKPAVELSGRARAKDLASIAKAYDASGIIDRPQPETLAELRHANYVVCSDLPRSVESAHALGFGHLHVADSLFRESALPHFDSSSIELPITAWVMVCRLLWLAGFSQNGEAYSVAKCRARQAANRLIDLAEAHGNVLLVGHGLMNFLIAQQLRANGWRGPAKPGKRFWEYGVYECGAVNGGLRENVKL
jgi:broad specificity phosphatase PhoE